jgi:putative Holliday junction resolvase
MNQFTVVMAFDFGLRHIGVAVGQSITLTANPLPPISAERGQPEWKTVEILLLEWKPAVLLVGLPFLMEGGEQALSFAARQFARELEQRFKIPVHLVDERLTTKEAHRRLAEMKVKSRGDISIHSFAAKLILESWLQLPPP